VESFTIEESQCISENSFLINIFDDIGFKSGGLCKGDRIHRIVLIHVSPSFFFISDRFREGYSGILDRYDPGDTDGKDLHVTTVSAS